jgi:hypothetical protein
MRPIGIDDVLFGGIYIFLSGLCGMATGDFFHPRFLAKRKDDILGALIISILALCKGGLIDHVAMLGFLNLLLPPFMDGFRLGKSVDYFELRGTMLILMHMVIYIVAVVCLKIWVLEKRRYRY